MKRIIPSLFMITILLVITSLSYAVQAVQITHDPSTDNTVLATEATITWTTDEAANGTISYDFTQPFNHSVGTYVSSTDHSFALTNLLSGTEYLYTITSKNENGTDTKGVYTFVTETSTESFIQLNPIPGLTANGHIYVSGQTRPNAKLKIFVNRNVNTIPRIDTTAGVTGLFNYNISLDAALSVNGTLGYNMIEVVSWDQHGKIDSKTALVIVDMVPPKLVLNTIPQTIGKEEAANFIIGGVTEPGTIISIFLGNDSKGSPQVSANGSFSQKIALPDSADVVLKITAEDAAHNVAEFVTNVGIDTIPPTLSDLEGMDGPQHFQIINIKGKTEPGAKVKIINMGDKYASYEQFKLAVNDGTRYTTLLDVTGLILGMERETTADSKGKFSLKINLMGGKDGGDGINQLWFDIRDKAGNKYEGSNPFPVNYKPDCGVWAVGHISSYPVSIFANFWNNREIPVSAVIPLHWMGGRELKDVQLQVIQEQGGSAGWSPNFGNVGTEDLSVQLKSEKQRWDVAVGAINKNPPVRDGNEVILHVPMIVPQNTIPTKDLPDQLEIQLAISIKFITADGETDTCQVYPLLSFGVNKPTNALSELLSPWAISKGIEYLNATIHAIDWTNDKVRKVMIGTGIVCGGMMLYDFIDGILTKNDKEEDSCPKNLKSTYWVCDRLVCPTVPPKPSEKGLFAQKFESIKEVEVKHPTNSDAEKEFKYKYWSRNLGQEAGDSNALFMWEADAVNVIPVELNQRLNLNPSQRYELSRKRQKYGDECKTFMVQETYDKEKNVVSYDLQCSSNELKDMTVDSANSDLENYVPRGYYNEECPYFDDTKCLTQNDDDAIDPTSSLFSSTRCLCLPGIYGHLEGYQKILTNAKKCFEQAKIGETSGGACERLLAVYICEFADDIFTKIISSAPKGSTGGATDRVTNTKKRMNTIEGNIKNRYSDTLFDKTFGLSTGRITNTLCIASITNDWSFLQQSLNTFVDEFPIGTIAHAQASSTPFGYNPLTGSMSIGYDIYVGIVPGDVLDISLTLECDPTWKNAEYCTQGSKVVKENPPIGLPPHMTKSDPAFDENMLYVEENAKVWYNKGVLKILPRGRDGEHQEEIIKEFDISRYGKLGYECTFSLMTGISCSAPYSDEVGYVQVDKSRLHISPASKGSASPVRSENVVNTVLVMNNHYQEPLAITLNYNAPGYTEGTTSAGQPKMFSIEPAVEDGQVYNLFTTQFPKYDAVGEGVKTEFVPIVDKLSLEEGKQPSTNLGLAMADVFMPNLPNNAKSKPLCIDQNGLREIGENPTRARCGQKIDLTKKPYKDNYITKINLYYYTLDSSANVVQPAVQGKSQLKGYLIDKSKWKEPPYTIQYLSSKKDVGFQTGTYNVLTDVVSTYDGSGTASIPYDDKPQEGKYSFTYQLADSGVNSQLKCTQPPVVELIEPTTDYVSNQAVPIAANIRDDCDNVAAVLVKIEGTQTGYEQGLFIYTNDEQFYERELSDNNSEWFKLIETFYDMEYMRVQAEPFSQSSYIKTNLATCNPNGNIIDTRFIPIKEDPTNNQAGSPSVYAFTWNSNGVSTVGRAGQAEKFLITVQAWDSDKNPSLEAKKTVSLSDSTMEPKFSGSFTGFSDGSIVRSCSSN